jgi:hypothetical protein
MVEFDVGVTALAALAFLGAGHLPESTQPFAPAADSGSPYRRHVTKALRYLLDHQDGSGAFGAVGQHYNYNHALAALAMVEAWVLAGDPRHRESAQAAIDFTVAGQQLRGGWDYTVQATGRNDLSVSGWQVMALRAAVDGGLHVPESALEAARRFAAAAVTPAGVGIYADQGSEAGRGGINMTAVGLLTRLYLGALPSEAGTRRAAERILREPPLWEATADWERTFQSYYYWYTATLALFHVGGDPWSAWNLFIKRTLLPLQSRSRHEDGSWPPESSWIGASGGRVYSTAMGVMILETYYRYAPLGKAERG